MSPADKMEVQIGYENLGFSDKSVGQQQDEPGLILTSLALESVYGMQISTESGEGGIRTPGRVAPTQHFQCCAFGRSATSPERGRSVRGNLNFTPQNPGFNTSSTTLFTSL